MKKSMFAAVLMALCLFGAGALAQEEVIVQEAVQDTVASLRRTEEGHTAFVIERRGADGALAEEARLPHVLPEELDDFPEWGIIAFSGDMIAGEAENTQNCVIMSWYPQGEAEVPLYQWSVGLTRGEDGWAIDSATIYFREEGTMLKSYVNCNREWGEISCEQDNLMWYINDEAQYAQAEALLYPAPEAFDADALLAFMRKLVSDPKEGV